MSVEKEAEKLARKAINDAIVNYTEGRKNITMMPQDSINEAVKILLAEDDKYLIEAKRNLGLLRH